MSDLEAALGHRFEDPALLRSSLIHRSYTSEHLDEEDNERMEFLGDAVLQLVVTEHLYDRYPGLREGEMAKARAACVNRTELALVARRLGVGDEVLLGVGEEQSGGRDKDSILADAMEAILAAVYLDAGLDSARSVILTHWVDVIAAKATDPGRRDFKTRLQERLAIDGDRPQYSVEGEGPDHERVFSATVGVEGTVLGAGTGRSKKEAEQEAARCALEALAVDQPD